MKKLRIAEEPVLGQEPGYFKDTRENKIVRDMFDRAEEIGRSAVMRGLMNIYRSNTNRNPELSEKMMDVIEKLKEENGWEDIPGEL